MCRYPLQALKPRMLLLYPPAPAAQICLSLFGVIFHIGVISKPLCDFDHCCDRKGAVVVTDEVDFFLFFSYLLFSCFQFLSLLLQTSMGSKNQLSSSIITDPQDLCAQLIPVQDGSMYRASAMQLLKGFIRILFSSARDERLKVNNEQYLKAILSVESVIMTLAMDSAIGDLKSSFQ